MTRFDKKKLASERFGPLGPTPLAQIGMTSRAWAMYAPADDAPVPVIVLVRRRDNMSHSDMAEILRGLADELERLT